uniref:Fibronectin type-III domain-containing protein n=1 Tax=Scleropages formosus TaxID=113540 RepID=A0A8C9RUY9_SCLFO
MNWAGTEDPLSTTHQLNAFSSPAGVLKSTALPTTSDLQFTTPTAAPTSSVHLKQPTAKGVDVIPVDFDDYSYYENDDTGVKAGKMGSGPIQKCNYDPCTHLQKPCREMFHNCLCPGQSPASEPPGTPPMSVGEVTHNSVQVAWCAPSSHVEHYLLEVEQVEGGYPMTQRVNSMFRRSTVFSLLGGQEYNICLKAENQAGSSQPTCVAFSTGVNNKPYLYALAGIAGLLAVVTVVLSVFLYKQCKKPPLANLGSLNYSK